ncbi:11218_t:CDS:1, partial [Paraglomus occultum]
TRTLCRINHTYPGKNILALAHLILMGGGQVKAQGSRGQIEAPRTETGKIAGQKPGQRSRPRKLSS